MISNKLEYARPEYLVETDWLMQHLDDSNLRVYDCAVNLRPNPDLQQQETTPFIFLSGRDHFNLEHIPNADYLDIPGKLSNLSESIPLMRLPEQQLTEVLAQYGIDDNSQVVLYSSSDSNWAARAWWTLRSVGFQNVAILNGGWKKWIQEKRPISNVACTYTPGNFAGKTPLTEFVDKEDVLQAIDQDKTTVISALPPEMYSGASDMKFGRKGRITGSVNVPFTSLHDPETGVYLPADVLQKNFDDVQVGDAENIITYCGAGIAASNDAFVLQLLGYENVSVYDGSMFEWGNDASLPMEFDNPGKG